MYTMDFLSEINNQSYLILSYCNYENKRSTLYLKLSFETIFF